MSDIAIVGAGAAGIATAIFTARRDPKLSIDLIDGAKKIGAKILVSGGGRCNVTNEVVMPEDFSGGSRNAIRRTLRAFPVEKTVKFFRELGVPLHREEEGKLFPDSNRARTVLDALLEEVRRLGVNLRTDHRVSGLKKTGAGFEVKTSQGTVSARRVVLATGGRSLPKSGSDGAGYRMATDLGHDFVETTPALVPLVLEGSFHAGLSGISHPVELTVRAEGEKPVRSGRAMLWTHFGISGPGPMDLSRAWLRPNLPAVLAANFLCDGDFEEDLLRGAKERPTASLRNELSKRLPARLANAILDREKIPRDRTFAHLGREERKRLVRAFCDWPVPVVKSRGYNFAEVTAGGIPLSEVNPVTMASRKCDGLHLVGEILDVDGRIGGYNFQWAWSSGWAAATGLAPALDPPFPSARMVGA